MNRTDPTRTQGFFDTFAALAATRLRYEELRLAGSPDAVSARQELHRLRSQMAGIRAGRII